MDLEATLADLAPRLLRYCVGTVGDPSLGEDVAQEALAALVGRWRRHGPPQSADAFVFTVARRKVHRTLWKRRLLEPLEAVFGHASPDPDPEEDALRKDDLALTLRGLDRLPAREREALVLVAGGELSTAGAAEVLGISRSALKMRVHRARQRLHAFLENHHETP